MLCGLGDWFSIVKNGANTRWGKVPLYGPHIHAPSLSELRLKEEER